MQRLLNKLLWLTGIGSAIVIIAPWLVIIGLMALILPGVILMMLPTAFIVLALFTVSWRQLRKSLQPTVACAAAGLITAATLFIIPVPAQITAKQRLALHAIPDIVPAQPVTLRGAVRVDQVHPPWNQEPSARLANNIRPFACQNLCVALLFAPGVDSVTINSSKQQKTSRRRPEPRDFARGARTFRLRPRAQCVGRDVVDIDLNIGSEIFGKSLEERRAVSADWLLKLSNDFCVTSEAPIDSFDLQVHEDRFNDPDSRSQSRWSFRAGPAQIQSFEIRRHDASPIVRIRHVKVKAPTLPLFAVADGPMSNFAFGWSRTTFRNTTNRYDQFPNLDDALATYTNLKATLPGALQADALSPVLRSRLDDALRDPSRAANDPVFDTVETYFRALKDVGASDADVKTVIALITDRRVENLSSAVVLSEPLKNHASVLRDAIASRLLAETGAADRGITNLNKLLMALPDGAFRTLNEKEQTLLNDTVRRTWVQGLIARLADQGGQAVSQLTQLLKFHVDALSQDPVDRETKSKKSARLAAHRNVVAGVRIALCRLGPDAAEALPVIEALADPSGRQAALARGDDWRFMLARLGKPVEDLKVPENVSNPDVYLKHLKTRLLRFDGHRHCGW